MHELWLTYHQASRASHPPTSQLIELDIKSHKMHDLEDVLEYIFAQGYVEAKLRPVSWWEKCSGEKVKGSLCVEELLQQGLGHCQETAMRLVIADIPPAVWISYHYVHNPAAPTVTQRVKIDALQPYYLSAPRPKLAHVSNYVFERGYLAAHLRSRVHWETPCHTRVEEHADLFELLSLGEGIVEEKALRLVVDNGGFPNQPSTPHHHLPLPSPHPHIPHIPHHIPHEHHHHHCGCN